MVTHRTVAAILRSMAVHQSHYLLKGNTMQLSEIKKTVITAATLIVSIGTLVLQYTTGFLPAGVAAAISGVVGVAGIVLNYLVPNTTSDPARVAGRSVALKGESTTA